MKFYHSDIVDVHYIVQVGNVVSVVVQDNHWWHLFLTNNSTGVLDHFH